MTKKHSQGQQQEARGKELDAMTARLSRMGNLHLRGMFRQWNTKTHSHRLSGYLHSDQNKQQSASLLLTVQHKVQDPIARVQHISSGFEDIGSEINLVAQSLCTPAHDGPLWTVAPEATP